MKISWLKAIVALPFNAVVTIPLVLVLFFDWPPLPPGIIFLGLALVLLAAGLSLAVWTMFLFASIGKGTLAPWNPTKRLVVEGPYAHVRNPMLAGVLAIILAESILLSSWALFAWFCAFLAINTVYFKLSEEKGLEKRFGMEYVVYKRNVPMWIPRLRAWKKTGGE